MSCQKNINQNDTEKARIRRHIISHTPPKKDNPYVSFPDHFSNGRIVIPDSNRLIDWNGSEWLAYVKDGVQWVSDYLTDEDIDMLAGKLVDELRFAVE